jgi:hypothetical protein
MDKNLLTGLIILPVLLLLAWLIIRNNEDRRNLERDLNRDYKKTKDSEKDVDVDLKED